MDCPFTFYTFNSKTYIPRDKIESTYSIHMPKFYDSKVEEILCRLLQCLESDKAVSQPSYEKPNQEKKQGMGFFATLLNSFSRPGINVDLSSTKTVVNYNYGQAPVKTDRDKAQEEEKKREESEQKQATIIGVISGLIFLGASYLVGQSASEVKNLEAMEEDINALQPFIADTKTQLEKNNSSKFSYTLSEDKSEILTNQVNLLNSILEKKVYLSLKKYADTAFKVRAFIAGSALFTVISALFKVRKMMAVGGVSLLCGFAVWLYTSGQKNNDKVLERNKSELIKNIKTLLDIFEGFSKESIAQPMFFEKKAPPQMFSVPNFVYWGDFQQHSGFNQPSAPTDYSAPTNYSVPTYGSPN